MNDNELARMCPDLDRTPGRVYTCEEARERDHARQLAEDSLRSYNRRQELARTRVHRFYYYLPPFLERRNDDTLLSEDVPRKRRLVYGASITQ